MYNVLSFFHTLSLMLPFLVSPGLITKMSFSRTGDQLLFK